MFCTGRKCGTDCIPYRSYRRFPDADTPTDQMYDLPDADRKDKEAVYYINYLKTKSEL